MHIQINGIHYIGDDVTEARAVGLIRTTRKMPEKVTMYRQRFSQHVDFFEKLPLNSLGPNNSLLYEETELTESGVGEIVEWDRCYVDMPAGRTEQGTAVKTYIDNGYQFLNGILVAAIPISFSATIKADLIYSYYKGNAAITIPALPQVVATTFPAQGGFASQVYVQAIGGFPVASFAYGGPTYVLPTNNYAYNFISGEIRRNWLGDIHERIVIYG